MVRRVLAQGGEVVVRDVPAPVPGPGDVLVRPRYSVISPGTERSIVRATRVSAAEAHEYPNPRYEWRTVRSGGVRGPQRMPAMPPTDAASLGYSLAGTVVEVGEDVLDLKPGDRVACSGSQCAYHCELVAVPRNLTVPVPDGVPLDAAAHVTLGAVSMEALRRTECTLGETVAVFGSGMLGLLIAQLAAAAGIYLVALDTNLDRLAMARKLGAVATLRDTGAEGLARVRGLTGGFGVDAVIVAAADPASDLVNFAFDLLRPRGRVVALGDFGMDLDRRRFFGAQATFVPSIAYGPGRYDPVYEENNIDLPISVVRWTENRNMELFVRLLAEGRVELAGLPAVRVPVGDAPRAYQALFEADSPLTGVLDFGDA
jgi:threonine dehydrogenase-like Zn-dependent dehydrogenase